jgi:polyhydroxybutyrate depolymerase
VSSPASSIASVPSVAATTSSATNGDLMCSAPAGRTTQIKWTVDGQQRSVSVHPPKTPEEGAAPIIVALHGYGGSGLELEQISKLSEAADERGWFVVYPDGSGVPQAWSDDPAVTQHQSDLVFLRQIIGDIVGGGCGDAARVIVTGMSQGGWLSDMAGCEMTDVVTGVVPVAGRDMSWPCEPAQPVAFAAVNGVLDDVLPYDGGAVRVAAPVSEVQSVEAWTLQRAESRNCDAQPAQTLQSPHVVVFTWSGCSAPMSLYRVEDGGHSWPQGGGFNHVDTELSITDVVATMLTTMGS